MFKVESVAGETTRRSRSHWAGRPGFDFLQVQGFSPPSPRPDRLWGPPSIKRVAGA